MDDKIIQRVRGIKNYLIEKYREVILYGSYTRGEFKENSDMLEIIDILDKLSDRETLNIVKEGRKVIFSGRKGVSGAEVFRKRKNK